MPELKENCPREKINVDRGRTAAGDPKKKLRGLLLSERDKKTASSALNEPTEIFSLRDEKPQREEDFGDSATERERRAEKKNLVFPRTQRKGENGSLRPRRKKRKQIMQSARERKDLSDIKWPRHTQSIVSINT